MFDLMPVGSDDQAVTLAMREEEALVRAATADGSQRDFAVVYIDPQGNLQKFQFPGKPSELFDKLEELQVDLQRDANGRFIGRFARSWNEPGEGRQCQSSDLEMHTHVTAYVAQLAAEQAKVVTTS